MNWFDQPDVWEVLSRSHRPLVLYGMGNGADILLHQLEKYGLSPALFCAGDDFVRGQTFYGLPVVTVAEAQRRLPEMQLLLAFGTSRPEVLEHLATLPLLVPEVPVAGENVFTRAFALEHKAELEQVYADLSDGLSRHTFDCLMRFRLSGDPAFLRQCECTEEDCLSLLDLNDREVYLDGGAYNGDTVLAFACRQKTWQHITAVEPDEKTFAKLQKNTAALSRLTCLQAALGEADGRVSFTMGRGRGSRRGEGKPIAQTSIDACGDFSFIKLDLEGAEGEALNGAVRNIRNGARMRVAAYHRAEDLFDLPLRVKKINSSYRVFLRHRPALPGWDTDWFFVP